MYCDIGTTIQYIAIFCFTGVCSLPCVFMLVIQHVLPLVSLDVVTLEWRSQKA